MNEWFRYDLAAFVSLFISTIIRRAMCTDSRGTYGRLWTCTPTEPWR